VREAKIRRCPRIDGRALLRALADRHSSPRLPTARSPRDPPRSGIRPPACAASATERPAGRALPPPRAAARSAHGDDAVGLRLRGG
jgi:hypothetical protein